MNHLFLSHTALFHGLTEQEITEALSCLSIREVRCARHETILRAGDTTAEIGLVMEGSVTIVVQFYWGGCHIFGHVEPGEIFAESYAAIPGRELLCDVIAAESCQILFLNINRLLTCCQRQCTFHQRLIHNLLRISASKNLNLSTRMMHTAPKSIRDRLLSYLSEQAAVHGSAHFTIPFSRQQLADYLGVDRSALSSTLSKLQREGFLHYRKNEFTLESCGLSAPSRKPQ